MSVQRNMGTSGSVFLIALAMVLLLVECKECPAPSKPHLSRCDMFYKCVVLPSQTIVWIPSKCDRGLIYEPGLQLCVLPADDWECSLGEREALQNHQDDLNVYGVSNLDYLQNEINNYRPQFYDSSVNTGATPPMPMKSSKFDTAPEEEEEDSVLMISDDVDNGDSVEVIQDLASNGSDSSESDEDFESSGDGPDEPTPQVKANFVAVPISREQDGAVASHLQRLSQLIQSMSNAQQQSERNQTEIAELTPNDLNAFLANYNIQHQVQPPSNAQKHQMSPDGKIPAERLLEILRLQQKIQNFSNDDVRMPTTPIRFQDKVGLAPTTPATKAPTRPTVQPVKAVRVNGNGVSAAQIVVNRPEGSVLFSLPGGVAPSAAGAHQQEPIQNYISQETLKAVLDLSKQMIASNTQQQQSYLQQTPIIRPIYYSVPIHDLPIPIISGYKTENSDSKHDKYYSDNIDDGKMEMVSSVKGHVDGTGDDRSTVIHNHIPITIETRKLPVKPTSTPTTTESATETRYDSFGDKIITSSNYHQEPHRVPYPPFKDEQLQGSIYGQNSYQTPLSQYQNYNPFNNYQFQPQRQQPQQQSQFLPYPNQNYPNSPHLSEYNINSYVNLNTPAYPTLRPTDAPTAPAPPVKKYSEHMPYRRPQNQQPFDDQYNTITRFDENDDDTNHIVDESYDHDLDSNLSVFDELTSLGQPLNQKPSSSAASNLESKQSMESMPGQLSSLSTGSHSPGVDDDSTKHKIVHYGSTFMTYQDYQQSVAPLLEQGGAQNVEVLTCITGARQPNSQDCAKYFVCNAATHKVLDYVCPQFTAFNQQSRFCDAKTYAECKGASGEKPKITVDANRRIHQEAKQAKEALEQATRIRDELIRDQQLTSQINLQTSQLLMQNKRKPIVPTTSRPAAVVSPNRRKTVNLTVTTTTARPRRTQAPRTRIIKCSEPTKVRDSLSIYNYFTCFKGADGSLKALKQTCPGGLVFCERMKMCTSQSRC